MQRRSCKYIRVIGFFFAVSSAALAQDRPQGHIYYASGEDFTLTARGRREVYQPQGIAGAGLIVGDGDMIQTGGAGFVELQLVPSATVIKIAENTSFRFTGPELGRSLSLELLYGRLRIITGPGENLAVKAGNAVVNLQKGDVSLDFVILPGDSGSARMSLRVGVFSGDAELVPLPGRADVSRIGVTGDETVSLENHPPLFFVERRALDTAIVDYWVRHNFTGTAPLAMPVIAPLRVSGAEPALEEPDPQIRYTPPEYTPPARIERIKNAYIIAGITLAAAGAALQGIGLAAMYAGNSRADYYINAGFVPAGLGIITLVISFFHH
jgi:hypothetical protein